MCSEWTLISSVGVAGFEPATLRPERGALPANAYVAQRRRQVAVPCDADALEAEPLRHEAQLRVERLGDGAAVDALLAVSRAHLQCRAGSIGFETEPSSEAVTEEEGKHVIAVHALGRRRVDLQPIAEIEEPLGARTLPD